VKFFARCIDSIERRPFILGSLFIFFLIFSCVEQLLYALYKVLLSDSVSKMFSFLSNTGSGKTVDLGTAIANTNNAANQVTATASGNTFAAVLISLIILFALITMVSVYLSGYFQIFNSSLKPNKEKTKGEFKKGLVKYYFKFTFYIFFHIIILLLTAAGAAFAMFPAIISFNIVYSGGKNGLLLTSIFLFLLSIIVIVFIISIILMYTLYMYPALVNFKKGSFFMARKVVKAKFWYIFPRVAAFVIALILWQWIIIKVGYGLDSLEGAIAGFLLNAIVKTYLVFCLIFFVFFTFRQIKNAIQAEEGQFEQSDGIGDISPNNVPIAPGTKIPRPRPRTREFQ